MEVGRRSLGLAVLYCDFGITTYFIANEAIRKELCKERRGFLAPSSALIPS